MPPLNIGQSTAKRIESGAGAIIAGKAKCVYEPCLGVRSDYKLFYPDIEQPDCYLTFCRKYEHCFNEGTIYFYQGMGRTKYCKIPDVVWAGGVCLRHKEDLTCLGDKRCSGRGAKLVHKAKILKSYAVKFEDLTEGIAEKCGFTAHWHKAKKREYMALECLQFNLIKKYNAKPGDIFQVVEFEKKVKQ